MIISKNTSFGAATAGERAAETSARLIGTGGCEGGREVKGTKIVLVDIYLMLVSKRSKRQNRGPRALFGPRERPGAIAGLLDPFSGGSAGRPLWRRHPYPGRLTRSSPARKEQERRSPPDLEGLAGMVVGALRSFQHTLSKALLPQVNTNSLGSTGVGKPDNGAMSG